MATVEGKLLCTVEGCGMRMRGSNWERHVAARHAWDANGFAVPRDGPYKPAQTCLCGGPLHADIQYRLRHLLSEGHRAGLEARGIVQHTHSEKGWDDKPRVVVGCPACEAQG